MELHVDAAFGHLNAFGFKELTLQGSVRFANEELSASAENPMPGNRFARRASSHRPARGSGATRQAQGPSNGPIR